MADELRNRERPKDHEIEVAVPSLNVGVRRVTDLALLNLDSLLIGFAPARGEWPGLPQHESIVSSGSRSAFTSAGMDDEQ
jgi:hypothetical protein